MTPNSSHHNQSIVSAWLQLTRSLFMMAIFRSFMKQRDGLPPLREPTCVPNFMEVAQRRSRDTEEKDLWTIFLGVNNDPEYDPKTNKFGTPQKVWVYHEPEQWGINNNGYRFPLSRSSRKGHEEEAPNRPPWLFTYPEAIRDPKGKLCSFVWILVNPCRAPQSQASLVLRTHQQSILEASWPGAVMQQVLNFSNTNWVVQCFYLNKYVKTRNLIRSQTRLA